MVCTASAEALDGARKQLEDIGVPTLLKPVSIEKMDEVLSSPGRRSNRPVIGD